MYRSRALTRPLCIVQTNARRSIASTPRARAVEDSPLSHSTPPHKGTSPWVLLAGLGVLGGGAYYLYGATESARIDKEKKELEKRAASVGAMAQEAKGRVQDAARDAKASADQRAQDVRESAQAKLKDARDGADAKWKETKQGAEKAYEDGKKRVDGVVQDGKAAAGASFQPFISSTEPRG
ncbi:hypothetical protein OF83DRAFT_1136874 [Amylostereum chailletii]|nr:hypothetical protein OF83DRAFT_1136874 [Amylostereum chailletii]